MTADQSGAGYGAAHGAADAGAVARLPEPSEREYGPTWHYRELARVTDATLTIAFVAADKWEGTGRAALDAIRGRKPASHLEVDSDWQPEDVPDAFVDIVAQWLMKNKVCTLHVTGPSEANSPGLGAIARALIGLAIERAAGVVAETPVPTPEHGRLPDDGPRIADGAFAKLVLEKK